MKTKIRLVEYVRKGPRLVEGLYLHALTGIVLCSLDVRTYVRVYTCAMRCARTFTVTVHAPALRVNGAGRFGNGLRPDFTAS